MHKKTTLLTIYPGIIGLTSLGTVAIDLAVRGKISACHFQRQIAAALEGAVTCATHRRVASNVIKS